MAYEGTILAKGDKKIENKNVPKILEIRGEVYIGKKDFQKILENHNFLDNASSNSFAAAPLLFVNKSFIFDSVKPAALPISLSFSKHVSQLNWDSLRWNILSGC